jgi:uncharacterized protein (TIGR00369 family)
MSAERPSSGIPEGFAPVPTASAFIHQLGPIYRAVIDGEVIYGILIDSRHTNRSENCHGGMLATIADMILIASCRDSLGISGPIQTVSLSLDYLAPVVVGSWVAGQGALVKATRSLIFARGELWLDKAPVLRFNGILARNRSEGSATQ